MKTLAALFGLDDTPDWRADALCREFPTEMFDAEGHTSPREAITVCARCPVAARCLQEALRFERDQPRCHGVRGGKSAYARRKILLAERCAA